MRRGGTNYRDDQPEASPLPYDIDLEQALLGVLMVDSHWFDKAMLDLRPEHLYDPLHQRLYTAMVGLWTKGISVTPLTVSSVMEGDAGFIEVGGSGYVIGLARAAPPLGNVQGYIRLIADKALRRDLIRIGEDVIVAASINTQEVNVAPLIASQAADALFQAASNGEAKPAVVMMSVADSVLKQHELRFKGQRFPTVKTGLSMLDTELGGFRGGDLIGIAGRSGMGKSSVLGGIALGAAMAKHPVLIFSLEMVKDQWVERTLCDLDLYSADANKPLEYSKFRNGTANLEEFDRAALSMQKLHGLSLYIIDDDHLTIEDITVRARAFAIAHGPLGLCVVDYTQIVRPSSNGRDRTREQEVAHIARGLKSLAKKLGWVVVAGIQLLNKGLGKGVEAERRPSAQDIRESGGIENECDVILATYRPAWFLQQRRAEAKAASEAEFQQWQAEYKLAKHKFELLCLKNRHGRRFDLELWCDMSASAVRDQRPISSIISDDEAMGLFR